ncbi:MAG: AbrB/MazE/SpoVT family DNA-binding domain-containing protein [Bryobacteraceae bacterium]
MGITSKGQITIPQEIRNKLGLLPNTEVEFAIVGDAVEMRKAKPKAQYGARGQAAINALRGTANTGMTTEEIMALMRGKD